MFSFSQASMAHLQGVHPDLVKCVQIALGYSPFDFCIVQGVRTQAQQNALYEQGRTTPGKIVTWTRLSKHIPQTDGYGHAIDMVPYINNALDWSDVGNFQAMNSLMLKAAAETGIIIEWGGNFPPGQIDLDHWQYEGKIT